jgi:hypothetical protein
MATTTSSLIFEEHLTSAFGELRRALEDAVGSVGVSPSVPQEVARRLGINRNLTWKISKVVGTSDLYQALQHLPGDEAIEILLQAIGRAGSSPDVIERVRAAQRGFSHVVEVHTGDRSTLELVLDSMGGGPSERLEQSRKLAFRGNSGLWGVQARCRATTFLLAPSADDPEKLDTGRIGGMIDLRRLRSGVHWPLFRRRTYHDDGTPMPVDPGREIAIDPAYDQAEGPMLIGDFCTPGLPSISLTRERLGFVYELGDGPIGNTGLCSCFFGAILRSGVPRYRTSEDRFGELFSEITLPIETLQLDLIVHRDLEFALSPQVVVRGQIAGVHADGRAPEIPIGERPVELTGRPPAMHSPVVPRYDELLTRVFARGNWDRREFRAFRLLVQYPPMHSTVIVRFELPERR